MSTHNGRNAAVCTYCAGLWASSSNETERVIQRTPIKFLHCLTGLITEQWINMKRRNEYLVSSRITYRYWFFNVKNASCSKDCAKQPSTVYHIPSIISRSATTKTVRIASSTSSTSRSSPSMFNSNPTGRGEKKTLLSPHKPEELYCEKYPSRSSLSYSANWLQNERSHLSLHSSLPSSSYTASSASLGSSNS